MRSGLFGQKRRDAKEAILSHSKVGYELITDDWIGLKTTGAPSMDELHACICYNLQGANKHTHCRIDASSVSRAIHVRLRVLSMPSASGMKTNLPTLEMQLCSGVESVSRLVPSSHLPEAETAKPGLSLIAFP